MGKVTYEKDMQEQAKREGLTLVTLDICGKHSKRDGVTYQGFLFTPEEVEEAWRYFTALASMRRSKGKKGGGK